MKNILTLIVWGSSIVLFAQESMSLEQCYTLLETNYPLAKQTQLYSEKNAYDEAAIKKNWLPRVDLALQATYQSDVTHVSIDNPMFSISPPNKDQYKGTFTVNQLIYDGGAVRSNLDVKEAEMNTQQMQVQVTLYSMQKQVNQLFYSILLMQEKELLLYSNEELIDAKMKELSAGVENGVVMPGAINVLEVEKLKLEQGIIEVEQSKKSLLTTLGQLIGTELNETTVLTFPDSPVELSEELNRPELELFALQKMQIDQSEKLLGLNTRPKVAGFLQGGYGNPGLNMLDNTFQPFYLVGVKMNWNVFDWNQSKKQKMSLEINKEIIDNQKEVFELGVSMELEQQQTEIDKIERFITNDEAIIELREKILKTADSELKNGTITPSAYTTELTNLFAAQNNLKTHQIQLMLAKTNYQTIKGN